MPYIDPETTVTEGSFSPRLTDDDVVQLREWGTDITHPLPNAPRPAPDSPGESRMHWYVGSSESCIVQLHNPKRLISRRHAMLSRDSVGWNLLRLSHNTLRVDGIQQNSTALAPGVEIEIGDTLLVAESRRCIRLRDYIHRILGWAAERQDVVDHALRAIRLSARTGAKLVLRGEGDLVGVAFEIHTRLHGETYPFVLCGAASPWVAANMRRIAETAKGLEALIAARGGTLCVQGRQNLGDYLRMAHLLRSPTARIQTVLCSEQRQGAHEYPSGFTIDLPSLSARRDELERVVLDYCADAAIALGLRDPAEILQIRVLVIKNASATVGEIAAAAYRLVAERVGGNLPTRVAQFAS